MFSRSWHEVKRAVSSPPPISETLRQRTFGRDVLHVFVLISFAFSGPLLDRLARQDLFVRRIDFSVLIGVALVVCVLVPGCIACIERVLGALFPGKGGTDARSGVHAIVLFCSFLLLTLHGWKWITQLPGFGMLFLASMTGILATSLYFRSPALRGMLTLASPGLILFPALSLYTACHSKWNAPADPLPEVRVQNPVPVVMVAFDEFCGTSLLNSDREIDEARAPHFAALAREGTWYRNATSVHPRTTSALPAMLSGRYVDDEKIPTPADYPQNLFSLLLATRQYKLTVFEPMTSLCSNAHSGTAEKETGFAAQLGSVLRTLLLVYARDTLPKDLPIRRWTLPYPWYGINETARVKREQKSGLIRYGWDHDRDTQFEHFLECVTLPDRPTLHFAHFGLPHFPWYYLPSGRRYREDNGAGRNDAVIFGASGQYREDWGSDELLVTQYYLRYLLQVGYADHLLGRLVAHLKEIGLYDRCLLVVAADHGVSFRPNHSRRSPVAANLADILSVPLFVKLPNQKTGGPSDRNVQTIDVFPTIADVLGIELPLPVDGVSLVDESQAEPAVKRFNNEGELLTIDPTFESKYGTLQDMLARFGGGSDPERLYRVGPHPDLLGRSLAELKLGPDSDIRIGLWHPRTFHFDPRSRVVPSYFEGELLLDDADPRLPVELAIVANGKIRAVTRTYLLSDIRRIFTALVPESSLREGENDLQILAIAKEGEGLTFHRCAIEHAPLKK